MVRIVRVQFPSPAPKSRMSRTVFLLFLFFDCLIKTYRVKVERGEGTYLITYAKQTGLADTTSSIEALDSMIKREKIEVTRERVTISYDIES